MTFPESAAVAGGDQALASDHNDLRNDALNQFIIPGGRISLSSSGGGTREINYDPAVHNRIALYDGTRWVLHEFSSLQYASVSIHSFAQYDVFIYDNSGVLTLDAEKVSPTTTLSAGVSAGSSVVCAVADTTGFSVGDPVWIEGSVSEIAIITAVSAGVSITVNTLGASHSSGAKVASFARTVSLGTQDARLVKSGDATRLYLGTVSFLEDSGYSGSGIMYPDNPESLVWNYYNRIFNPFYYNVDNTYSHTYSSTTVRRWGFGTSLYIPMVFFLVGVDDQPVEARYRGLLKATSNGDHPVIGLGLDDMDAFESEIEYGENSHSNPITLTGGAWIHPGAGLHALFALEAAISGGGTFSDISIKGGMFA